MDSIVIILIVSVGFFAIWLIWQFRQAMKLRPDTVRQTNEDYRKTIYCPHCGENKLVDDGTENPPPWYYFCESCMLHFRSDIKRTVRDKNPDIIDSDGLWKEPTG